jgi:predicted dehydrogenase
MPFSVGMKTFCSRRHFLQKTSLLAGSLAVMGPNVRRVKAAGPNEKVHVAIIGCNGRGMDHIKGYLSLPNSVIVCICDVDSRAMSRGIDAVAKIQGHKPRGEKDLRKLLEDPDIDAVSIAVPDHWHTPAAMLACAAGKHVYVEKPGSHNGHESELIVTAARRHKKVVQMGNQRRSWPWVIESIQALHDGAIGKLFFARAWYTNHRGTIGKGSPAPVPDWLDYSLWQGPAPEQVYHDNVIHYNWHWFWNWGTGELGNNGVHSLDLARWGLGVDAPKRVTCGGNRYHFQDDQETPDLYLTSFDFGDKAIVWEGQSCDPRGFEGAGFGVSYYGENGSMAVAGNSCVIYDLNQKVVREIKGKADDSLHFKNFIEGIRQGEKLNAEIEEGQRATLLCHLGNLAWRTGETVNYDPAKRKIIGSRKAADLWRRHYRPGWEPKV